MTTFESSNKPVCMWRQLLVEGFRQYLSLSLFFSLQENAKNELYHSLRRSLDLLHTKDSNLCLQPAAQDRL